MFWSHGQVRNPVPLVVTLPLKRTCLTAYDMIESDLIATMSFIFGHMVNPRTQWILLY